jgi:tetratricopeptide (TPR) repeat protein
LAEKHTTRVKVIMIRLLLTWTVWLPLLATAVASADDSWVGLDVLKAKPRVLADRDGDKKVYFELKGAWIPVLKDQDGRLRVRGYDGKEGWADKADFVLARDAPGFFTDVIRRDAKNPWPWHMRGVAWAMKGEPDAAIKDYSEAIRLDPKFASAFAMRGGAWGDKRELDKAIRDYSEAIRLDPNCHPLGPAALFNARGNLWGAKKEHDKAIRDYDEAICHDPTYAPLFNHRGNAWFEKKEFDKAIRDYDECIRLGAKDIRLDLVDPSVFVNRGDAWRAKKEYAKAASDYDAAIRLDPKYAMAVTKKAYLLATCADDQLRDVARAQELVRDIVKLRPASPYNEELLGVIAAAQGKFDDAIRHQKRALEDKHYSDRRSTEASAMVAAYEEKRPYRE